MTKILFVALSLILCAAFSPQRIKGAWIPIKPDWQKVPYGDPAANKFENVAEMRILYFADNGQFAILDGTVDWLPHHFTAVSQGDPLTIYLGFFNKPVPGDVRYRLVSATEAEGQKLPNIRRISRLAFVEDGTLIFEGSHYKRLIDLDAPVRTMLKQTLKAQFTTK
jgi:hypothetical protein